ncbi:hypothetical protein Tco_0362977 [Tanacetum coccineum]
MVVVMDLDEIEEVNANCILMANLQQTSTSGTQSDNAPVYDTDGSAEVQLYENCYNNEIFNMFTQEEQYTELLEPIPELHQVPQNDSNVISEVSSVEQGRGIVEQHSANVEETSAYHESLFHNLAAEVEKVNSVNRKMKEKNAELTTELARYKNQERCFEISQEKYDKLERCYQQSVYQEQCLSKRINALHLSSGKQIMALNEEISNLNKQLSKEKSTVSSLQEEKKRLKSDFKIREDELLDKQIQLENKVKELDNILVKTGQSIQTMHMLSPKPDSFYHTEQKMAFVPKFSAVTTADASDKRQQQQDSTSSTSTLATTITPDGIFYLCPLQEHSGSNVPLVGVPSKNPWAKMAPKRATRSTSVTTTPAPTATTTTSVTNAQLQAMIDQCVTAALAARDANRNGDDSLTSGTGGKRTERVP